MVLNHFYVVTKRTAKFLTMAKLATEKVSGDGFVGTEKPVIIDGEPVKETGFLAGTLRKKLTTNWKNEPCVYIKYGGFASPWDGEPKGFNNLD